jgi:hypothetical protein
VDAVKAFYGEGGTVLAIGASADWLAEALDLPVSNALRGVPRGEFYCPGAMLAVEVETGTPLGWGMPARVAAMIDDSSAFQTRPSAGEDVRVVAARYPDRPLLLSGWIRGEERMRRRAAVVEVRQGAGRAVLYAFAPHFRAQMRATFPLLLNAVAAEMMDAPANAPKPRRP